MIGVSDALAANTAIHDLLERYFDALHHCDVELLAGVLHPSAIYATVGGGELIRWSVDEYLPVIAARESPASRGEARTDAIDSIEFAGPDTALARVRCSTGPKHFVDLLSLLRIDGRWWVIAKVFAFEGRDDAPARQTAGSLPCPM
jgi:4-oxalocrotonate tautomerase